MWFGASAKVPAVVLAAALAVILTACGMDASSAGVPPRGELTVAAAENFWGSIAAQLGGDKVAVRSIISDPGTDPHSYEPTAADGVTIARSRLAIVNGIGYDAWASRLIAADGSGAPAVLDVGRVLGLGQGDNPHQWYSPASVERVIEAIVADYKRLDPRDGGYFEQRRNEFETQRLAEYRRLTAAVRARYAGVPVGYSESIFQPLGESLGLRLMTPYSFAKAIAEGTDVSASDKQTVDTQVEGHAIKVWIFNSQNATPDVRRVNQIAAAAGIPVATITETLSPASATFEQWQDAQLRGLISALRRATGR